MKLLFAAVAAVLVAEAYSAHHDDINFDLLNSLGSRDAKPMSDLAQVRYDMKRIAEEATARALHTLPLNEVIPEPPSFLSTSASVQSPPSPAVPASPSFISTSASAAAETHTKHRHRAGSAHRHVMRSAHHLHRHGRHHVSHGSHHRTAHAEDDPTPRHHSKKHRRPHSHHRAPPADEDELLSFLEMDMEFGAPANPPPPGMASAPPAGAQAGQAPPVPNPPRFAELESAVDILNQGQNKAKSQSQTKGADAMALHANAFDATNYRPSPLAHPPPPPPPGFPPPPPPPTFSKDLYSSGGGGGGGGGAFMSLYESPPAPVDLTNVQKGQMPATVTVAGNKESLPPLPPEPAIKQQMAAAMGPMLENLKKMGVNFERSWNAPNSLTKDQAASQGLPEFASFAAVWSYPQPHDGIPDDKLPPLPSDTKNSPDASLIENSESSMKHHQRKRLRHHRRSLDSIHPTHREVEDVQEEEEDSVDAEDE